MIHTSFAVHIARDATDTLSRESTTCRAVGALTPYSCRVTSHRRTLKRTATRGVLAAGSAAARRRRFEGHLRISSLAEDIVCRGRDVATLHVALQEGFLRDRVVVRVNGAEIANRPEVTCP